MARGAAITTTIPNGEAVSGAVDLGLDSYPAGVIMPAAWTAAGLTFQISMNGTTWVDVYNGATEYTFAGTAGAYHTLDPNIFRGVRYLKVRSGTAGTPVNQGALRTLSVVGARL